MVKKLIIASIEVRSNRNKMIEPHQKEHQFIFINSNNAQIYNAKRFLPKSWTLRLKMHKDKFTLILHYIYKLAICCN